MARKFIDCREHPSANNCTIAISADGEGELVEAAALHAISAHQHADTPELRDSLRSSVREGSPG